MARDDNDVPDPDGCRVDCTGTEAEGTTMDTGVNAGVCDVFTVPLFVFADTTEFVVDGSNCAVEVVRNAVLTVGLMDDICPCNI